MCGCLLLRSCPGPLLSRSHTGAFSAGRSTGRFGCGGAAVLGDLSVRFSFARSLTTWTWRSRSALSSRKNRRAGHVRGFGFGVWFQVQKLLQSHSPEAMRFVLVVCSGVKQQCVKPAGEGHTNAWKRFLRKRTDIDDLPKQKRFWPGEVDLSREFGNAGPRPSSLASGIAGCLCSLAIGTPRYLSEVHARLSLPRKPRWPTSAC